MANLGVPVSGRIAAGEAAVPGRVLARFTDLGLGQRLRALVAAPDGPVPDWVAPYCFQVLREWDWAERPVAVAGIPSRRRPQLVESLAAELARRGKLIDLGPLERTDRGDDSEAAGNSAFRLRQVYGSFGLSPTQQEWLAHADGPVLLVDDFTDSRWTQTVAARVLRLGGAPSVLPFALAAVG